jgi:hypothetical protein
MKLSHILASLLTLVATTSSAFGAENSATLFINFDGAILSPGWDNSAGNMSSLVWAQDLESLTVPEFANGIASRDKIVQCIKDGYAPFAIDVVTERPARGDYIMVVVGGSNDMLGYHGSTSGVSPFTGSLIEDAIVFVFAESVDNRSGAICDTAVHESGHALGLDHAYLCEDPMSYLFGCGPKSFQDVDAYCGEYDARACEGGSETQNSYQYLATTFGLRDDDAEPVDLEPEPIDLEPEPVEPEPGPENPEPDPWTDPEPWIEPEPDPPARDAAAPDLYVYGPDNGETVDGDTYVHIVLWAADDTGIADIELGWATPDDTYIFSCNDMPDELPVMCTRDGNYYVFSLLVGTGERAFAVRATDDAGNETVTDARVLTFS